MGTYPPDQLIAQADETVVEVVEVVGRPVRTFGSGKGFLASESNVKYVGLVVARVVLLTSAHALPVARRRQGEGDLAHASTVTVAAVGVAPNSIKLAAGRALVSLPMGS